jgi:SAM-dependent methyltransferase
VRGGRAHHTGRVTVTYGEGVPGDDQLHLIGDVTGKRVIELGIAGNAIALAQRGAHVIAVDQDVDRIADLRADMARAEVSVECHQGDLADLGFAPSGTIDVVVSVHTLHDDTDLGRTLRQVHRVLKPGAPFVLALDHPFAAVGIDADGEVRSYGEDERTVGELLTALARTNFRIEAFHELGVDATHPIPTTLVLKARKQGS